MLLCCAAAQWWKVMHADTNDKQTSNLCDGGCSYHQPDTSTLHQHDACRNINFHTCIRFCLQKCDWHSKLYIYIYIIFQICILFQILIQGIWMKLLVSSRGESSYLDLVIRPRHPGSDPGSGGEERWCRVTPEQRLEISELHIQRESERSTPNNNIQLLPHCQPAHTQHGLNKY